MIFDKFITSVNQAWQGADYATLGACYHPDAVLLPPDLGPVITGRDAIVDTYREFDTSVDLLDFQVRNITTHNYGTTAVVHMDFAVDYRFKGQPGEQTSRAFSDEGQEIYVINAEGPEPLIVWRQQIVTASVPRNSS